MQKATVRDIERLIYTIAPLQLQEPWDNSGLLLGRPDAPVRGVLVALDLNRGVMDEAVRLGAQMIIAHHPIFFEGAKRIREDEPEGALVADMIRARIAFLAAHTNYDNACPGVADALAEALRLSDVEPLEHGLRMGRFDGGDLGALSDHAQSRLGGPVRVYGSAEFEARRVAVCGGAGSSFWREALSAGADCYLTGEVKYHDGLDAWAAGMAVIEAGHRQTELPAVKGLKSRLQKMINEVQYEVMVFASESGSGDSVHRI